MKVQRTPKFGSCHAMTRFMHKKVKWYGIQKIWKLVLNSDVIFMSQLIWCEQWIWMMISFYSSNALLRVQVTSGSMHLGLLLFHLNCEMEIVFYFEKICLFFKINKKLKRWNGYTILFSLTNMHTCNRLISQNEFSIYFAFCASIACMYKPPKAREMHPSIFIALFFFSFWIKCLSVIFHYINYDVQTNSKNTRNLNAAKWKWKCMQGIINYGLNSIVHSFVCTAHTHAFATYIFANLKFE